ncbi:MAG: hypothetical protein Q8K63_09570 [Acidimicrobiales bacterium]|nr:hypothetical protein [Acidimicrobiales bacterium]
MTAMLCGSGFGRILVGSLSRFGRRHRFVERVHDGSERLSMVRCDLVDRRLDQGKSVAIDARSSWTMSRRHIG